MCYKRVDAEKINMGLTTCKEAPQDWINETDSLLKFRKKEMLKDSGKISHKQAIDKAHNEYEKYRVKKEQQYISSMDEMYKKYLEERKK